MSTSRGSAAFRALPAPAPAFATDPGPGPDPDPDPPPAPAVEQAASEMRAEKDEEQEGSPSLDVAVFDSPVTDEHCLNAAASNEDH